MLSAQEAKIATDSLALIRQKRAEIDLVHAIYSAILSTVESNSGNSVDVDLQVIRYPDAPLQPIKETLEADNFTITGTTISWAE